MSEPNAAGEVRAHHAHIREELARRIERALDRGTRDDLDAVVALLEGELIAHARAEQEQLYPVVDRLIREHGRATATMDVDHEYIGVHVSRVAVAVERMRVTKERQARMAARGELRDALLRLSTLLEVHLEKEERVYLPLLGAHLDAEEQATLVAHLEAGAPAREDEIDIRRIPQRVRHAQVLERFDGLRRGGSIVLVSDHDPRPLSYLFAREHAGAFSWDYLERGPVWRVRITRTAAG